MLKITLKNLPTLKVFNTYRDLKEVESIDNKYLFNNFHGVVPNKAFKKVVYFHTSYHLYQFDVYKT